MIRYNDRCPFCGRFVRRGAMKLVFPAGTRVVPFIQNHWAGRLIEGPCTLVACDCNSLVEGDKTTMQWDEFPTTS